MLTRGGPRELSNRFLDRESTSADGLLRSPFEEEATGDEGDQLTGCDAWSVIISISESSNSAPELSSGGYDSSAAADAGDELVPIYGGDECRLCPEESDIDLLSSYEDGRRTWDI